MKKKLVLVLVLLLIALTFTGCERDFTPDPAVREFLNTGLTAEKAYSRIAKASYTEERTLQNKQGQIKGQLNTEVKLDKSDEDNLYLYIHATFSGDYVEEKVVERTSILSKVDGSYQYCVETVYENVSEPKKTTETMKEEDAVNLITAVIYVDNGVYAEGLYYGDYFLLRIFKFPAESFYVDVEQNLCVFDEGMLIKGYDDIGEVKLFQVTKINELGLLVYNSERYESVESDYVMTCEIIPTYEYKTTAD